MEGKNEGIRASYQQGVDNSVEKLHLSNESETDVERGVLKTFTLPRRGLMHFEKCETF